MYEDDVFYMSIFIVETSAEGAAVGVVGRPIQYGSNMVG